MFGRCSDRIDDEVVKWCALLLLFSLASSKWCGRRRTAPSLPSASGMACDPGMPPTRSTTKPVFPASIGAFKPAPFRGLLDTRRSGAGVGRAGPDGMRGADAADGGWQLQCLRAARMLNSGGQCGERMRSPCAVDGEWMRRGWPRCRGPACSPSWRAGHMPEDGGGMQQRHIARHQPVQVPPLAMVEVSNDDTGSAMWIVGVQRRDTSHGGIW